MADPTFWTPANLAAVLGCEPPALLNDGREKARLAGLSIDTRTLRPGQVYLALRGHHHDGHDFIPQAFAAGAAMAIVDRTRGNPATQASGQDHRARPAGAPGVTLAVPDTLAALQRLAAAYRDHLSHRGCRVIAVAGSNGKTTTRHMIWSLLSRQRRGTQSPKSFNNHIGVPLTLLAAGEDDDFVVVEIGTNHMGEVAALARIARPDAAVITSIGREHMEHFGTLDNVAKEEFSLFDHLAPQGLAVVPAPEAERLKPLRLTSTIFDDDPAVPHDLPLPGAHNQRNAAAAAAVARWFGISDDDITAGLRDLQPVPGRLERLIFGDVTVLNDAYNANPDSMREALNVLSAQAGTRRVAVLGDMFELGDAAPDLHRQTARRIVELDRIDAVITIGPLSMHTAEALRDHPDVTITAFAAFADDTPGQVASLLQRGDIVLLKASRGMKLERLLPAIEQRFAMLEPQMNTDKHG